MHPIKGESYLTQGYGLTDYARSKAGKIAYKNFQNGIHPGLDFGTHGINLPVISVCSGKVIKAKYDGGWGNHIEIEGEDGWRRQYCHLSAIFIKVGDKIEKGQEIGKVGTTGASTGIHLHFGNRRWNKIKWEYRDPTGDLTEVVEPEKITGKLIKSNLKPDVYVFGGTYKYPIPNWSTKLFFFPTEEIQVLPEDQIVKIPTGDIIPIII